MKAITPIVPGHELPTITFAANQPEYNALPAFRDSDGTVITRWKLSFRERLRILLHGDLWLWVLTFNNPLQPVVLETTPPKMTPPA